METNAIYAAMDAIYLCEVHEEKINKIVEVFGCTPQSAMRMIFFEGIKTLEMEIEQMEGLE